MKKKVSPSPGDQIVMDSLASDHHHLSLSRSVPWHGWFHEGDVVVPGNIRVFRMWRGDYILRRGEFYRVVLGPGTGDVEVAAAAILTMPADV